MSDLNRAPLERYILELPTEASPVALQSLSALAVAYSGRVRRPGDPMSDGESRPEHVDQTELEDISQTLWGSTIYAEVAGLYLPKQQPARKAYEHHTRAEGSHHYTVNDNFGLYSYDYSLDAENPMSDEETEAWVRQGWEGASGWPYDLAMRWEGDLTVLPAPIHRERLATFANKRVVASLSFKGSMGKALDVLMVAAEVTPIDQVDRAARQADGSFIDFLTLIDAARSSELPVRNKRDIVDHLGKALLRQARGQKEDDGIIVEGKLRDDVHSLIPERVMLQSIERICSKLNNPAVFTDFLADLRQQVAD